MRNTLLNSFKVFTEHSLTRNITIVTVVAVTSISILSLLIHLRITSSANEKQFDQKRTHQISYLKDSLQLPLWNYNYESVKKLGQMMMTSDIISSLSIKDPKGNDIFIDEKHGETYDVAENIDIIYRDRKVGTFEISLTRSQFKLQQKKMILVGVVTIMILILSILIAVILSINWFIKKPLLDFSQRIDALAEKKYVNDKSSTDFTELQGVIDRFNQMSVKIEKRENDLIEANKMLKKSEEKYRSLNNNIPVGIFRIKPNGSIVDYNAFLLKILDVPAGTDISVRKGEDFYSNPKDRQIMINEIMKNKEITGYECQLKSWSNKTIWTSISARGIEDTDGSIKYIDGIAEDITEKKAYQKQLEKFATVIKQANEEVVITDPEGLIQYVNPSFEKNTGYTADEVIGQRPSILKSGYHKPAFYENLWRTILDSRIWKGIIKNKCKDGRMLDHDMTITPIVGSENEISAFVSIRRDITKQLELEQQVQQSQKMEAIGTLAGGIAHDFNNILSGIFGYCQLAQTNIENADKANDCISKAVKAAQRATELVQQILTFSRQTDYEKRPFCVYLEVNEALKLIRSTIPSTIDIKKKLDSRSLVMADPTKIHQVVMNLCTNAYHAMRKTGGILSVSLSDREFDMPRQIKDKTMPKGNYLLLEVSDTGCGMDTNTLMKSFDPYFTTKNKGEGTGLGLSIVHAVLDEHDGFIEVSSAPGKGTHFSLYFPIVENSNKSEIKEEDTAPIEGNETVMIVDDEKDIRDSFREIIENSGYNVVPFGDGEKALDAFRSNPEKFDIIITDMTMPGKTGAQLIEEIKSIKKDVIIVLCSGFSDTMNEKEAIKAGASRYLIKPIFGKDLVRNIRELLDQKKA